MDIAPERARYRDFVEVAIDDRDMRPGAKYYHWERRGVPVRIELGPRDVAKGQVVAKMRVDSEAGRGKEFVPEAELVAGFRDRLLRYQDELLRLAGERRDQASVSRLVRGPVDRLRGEEHVCLVPLGRHARDRGQDQGRDPGDHPLHPAAGARSGRGGRIVHQVGSALAAPRADGQGVLTPTAVC